MVIERKIPLSRARRELVSLLRWVRHHHGRVIITRKGRLLGELVPTAAEGRYVVTVVPAGDDALIPLPDALMEELGWNLGDTLLVDQGVSGKLILRRADHREPL